MPTMKCVNCAAPMLTLELDAMEIDHCPACSGVWLDSGELSIILGADEFREESEIPLREATPKGTSKRRCPICRVKMELVSLGNGDSVIIDRCGRRHGLWFDRGELNRLIEHLDPSFRAPLAKRLRSIFGM